MRKQLRLTVAFTLAVAILPAAAPCPAAVVKGRVIDSAGAPVANAEIRIWRKAMTSGNRSETQPVAIGDGQHLRTDGGGRFETADLPDLGSSIRVVVQAEQLPATRSRWIAAADQKVIDVGDLTARRLRTVTGQVVDSRGAAVQGATIFNCGDAPKRVEAVSDATGVFRLSGVPEGRICLFVEKTGFRFSGRLLEAEGDRVDLALVRCDEPQEPLRTLAPVLPLKEEKELARQVLAPYLERLAHANDRSKTMAIFAVRSIDEWEALERLEALSFEDAEQKDRVRELTIEAMAYRSSAEWDEIKPWVESLSTPKNKTAFYVFAARAELSCARPEPQALLNEALLHARAIDEPERRALEFARISCGLFDLGLAEQAAPLAREAFATLDTLPVSHGVSWDATGAVAMAVARYDLRAARALLGRLQQDAIYALEMGRLAHQAAMGDAEQAEALWLESRSRSAAQTHPLRMRDAALAAPMCYRLAQRNPNVARRIAEGLEEASNRIAALGVVAQALAETDEPAARKLLREVFSELPSADPVHGDADEADWRVVNSLAGVCCQLLPLAERIDPQFARECLWRAVALRLPPADDLLDDEAERANLHLIAMLARYDRQMAAALLEPLQARFDEFIAGESREAVLAVIVAAASLDPRKAVKLLDRLPATADANVRQLSNITRVLYAWYFGAGDLSRWRWEAVGYSNPADYESWR